MALIENGKLVVHLSGPCDSDRQSPTDEAFHRLVRLAARDPIVRVLFASILEVSDLPAAERTSILMKFLSAGTESDGRR
jgi:hypothetical protein